VRVHDPPPGVRGFATEFEVSARLQIELRTCSRQLANPRRTFFDEDLNRFCVSQGGTRGQSVLPVQLGRVSGAERGGNAALDRLVNTMTSPSPEARHAV
jgi:hypothetical protein